jgi:exodeoxyribonuclease VII large subunit
MPLETSADSPVPVRRVSQLLADWIHRLGAVWVEGQVTQVTRRPGTRTAFLTLRDPAADVSLPVSVERALLDALEPPVREGLQVVVHARPRFWANRGSLSLMADEIRPVGVGALLARLEALKQVLAAEGLFAPERKQPLPFLPRTVGLICGRASAAEQDVVENARRRWPAVRFRIEEVPVQGPEAVTEVTAALQKLDRDPEVDVVVITRGGGSVEDLLAFSNETLLRAVAAARTPVVSAIGHEQDSPLLDLVADHRASTPTDAGKRVVPDVREELTRLGQLRDRSRRNVRERVDRERAGLASLRSRPVLADPHELVRMRALDVDGWRQRSTRSVRERVLRARDDLGHTLARVRALSPAATLERGYAVLQRDGAVVRAVAEVTAGDAVTVRLADGRVAAEVTGTSADAPTRTA